MSAIRNRAWQNYYKRRVHPKAGRGGGIIRRGIYVPGEPAKRGRAPKSGRPHGRDYGMGFRGYVKPHRGWRA